MPATASEPLQSIGWWRTHRIWEFYLHRYLLEILCSVLLFVCCKGGLYEYLLDVTLINLCCPACCKVFLPPPSTIAQPVSGAGDRNYTADKMSYNVEKEIKHDNVHVLSTRFKEKQSKNEKIKLLQEEKAKKRMELEEVILCLFNK